MQGSRKYSYEEVERAVKIAARIVVLYGEIYLPVFERLHKEFEKLKEDQNKESLAFKLAKTYAGIEETE